MFKAAITLVSIGLLSSAGPLFSQLATQSSSLSMDVRDTASGGAGDASTKLKIAPGGKPLGGGWVTAEQRDYAQHHEQDSSRSLEVQVRNMTHDPATADLEWYFFSKPIKGGNETLFERGTEKVTVAPARIEKYSIASKSVHNSTTKELHTTNGVDKLGRPIPPSASVHKSGSRVSGWLVRLMVNGLPLAARASSPTFESMAATPGDELAAAYNGKR